MCKHLRLEFQTLTLSLLIWNALNLLHLWLTEMLRLILFNLLRLLLDRILFSIQTNHAVFIFTLVFISAQRANPLFILRKILQYFLIYSSLLKILHRYLLYILDSHLISTFQGLPLLKQQILMHLKQLAALEIMVLLDN